MDLQISNTVEISVSQTPAGIGSYNTSNLALFSSEVPGGSFGAGAYKIYLEPSEVGKDFGTTSVTYKMAVAVFSQAPNIRAADGYLAVIPFVDANETTTAAIIRTKDLLQYFGAMTTRIETEVNLLAAAAAIQSTNKIAFFVQRTAATLDAGGTLDKIRTGGLRKSRGLYYGGAADVDALVMQAAYAGRALSTNFSGSNTTSTMNLKDLIGVQPDPSMTQTLYNKALAAGADIYASIQGVPKVFSFGTNGFFDQVYNLGWFIGALQVAGFNYLAQASTKIPQTEEGMDGLKGAYRTVCEQAVTNRYAAPGRWTSPTTFGVQEDLLANVEQRGYYIYSGPIAQQLQADREARVAPLVQIALKEAGAIHKGTVIVNINS